MHVYITHARYKVAHPRYGTHEQNAGTCMLWVLTNGHYLSSQNNITHYHKSLFLPFLNSARPDPWTVSIRRDKIQVVAYSVSLRHFIKHVVLSLTTDSLNLLPPSSASTATRRKIGFKILPRKRVIGEPCN